MKLFQPITLRSLTVKNRIWLSPMCTYSVENQDGIPTDWHLVHLGARAIGGAGLVMAEATAVRADGRISAWDTGLWSDNQVSAWHRITDFIRAQGAASAVQLAHAGRKGSIYRDWSGSGPLPDAAGGWTPISSTSTPFPGLREPHALTASELSEVVRDWSSAAKRAVSAGFDAIEIHAAHGYLIHQFLSPITNQRVDDYGGSLENRARLLLEIVDAVRATIPPSMPLLVRFSATDYSEGGWDVDQTATVAQWVVDRGVDLIDVSSGGLIPGVTIPTGPGYQVGFAEKIAAASSGAVGAVGQITTADQAEQILRQGETDVVFIGRAFLRDANWALRAAHELGVEIGWVPQYKRGMWPRN